MIFLSYFNTLQFSPISKIFVENVFYLELYCKEWTFILHLENAKCTFEFIVRKNYHIKTDPMFSKLDNERTILVV